MRTIATIHYVDFSGDGKETACGLVPPADYHGVTIFLSSATCPACKAKIMERIELLRQGVDNGSRGVVQDLGRAAG